MKAYMKIRLDGVLYTGSTIHRFSGNAPCESWRIPVVQFLQEWFNKEDFILTRTSGSTGEPKTIRLSKQNMVNSATRTCQYFNLDERSTALLCLPANYIAGKMMLVRALVAGFNLLTLEPSGNPFADLHAAVDFAAVTPFQIIQSHQVLQRKTIKKLIVGGGPVNRKLQEIIVTMSSEVYETYGMTETCSHIAIRKLNGGAPGDYFTVLPGVEIRQDERRCLVIYALDITDSVIITNDVVKMHDKNQFKWLGRFDQVINSGGIKLFPETIEKKIEPFLDRRFFIGSLPDDKLTEKVILVIEGDTMNELQLTRLNNDLKPVLNHYEMPRIVSFFAAFDTSLSGKVLKPEILRKILNAGSLIGTFPKR